MCTDASGNATGQCAYEPYGEFTGGASACTIPTSYRFAGMQFDSETGLYHTWFRQYDPSQGRWLSVDPLPGHSTDPQSLNRYVYVLNDPVNLTDPLGLDGGVCMEYDPETGEWYIYFCVTATDSVGGSGVGGNPISSPNGRVPRELAGLLGGTGGGSGCNPAPTIFENGLPPCPNALDAPAGSPPQQQQHRESYADCVKNDGNHFSLQNGLRYISGGRLGNGWVSGALLSNNISSGIELFQSLFAGSGSRATNTAAGLAVSQAAEPAAGLVASKTPDVTISVTVAVPTPAMSVQERTIHTVARRLPTGSLARIAGGAAQVALRGLSLVKTPIDLTVSAFSAVVCGIGR